MQSKRIGLIGGMSPESAVNYYHYVNRLVNQQIGKHHTADLMLASVDFEEVVSAMHENRWSDLSVLLIEAANRLIRSGVDFIAICCNSAHKVAESVQQAISVPLLHILQPTGQAIVTKGKKVIGILGNRFTMENSFYADYLRTHWKVQSLIPGVRDREIIHHIIYSELCYGKITTKSKQTILQVIDRLQCRGAEGVILGCTELPMLVTGKDTPVDLFDTTFLHTQGIVNMALTSPKEVRMAHRYEDTVMWKLPDGNYI